MVQDMEPEHVAQRLQDLCGALGILPRQAAFMVARQPAYMLLKPLPELRAKVAELAEALGVPQAAVLRAALTVPSILRRSTAVIDRRVRAYSALLQCSPVNVLHVMARGPEYLSDTPSSVRQRMMALGHVLRRPRCTIAAMLQARPDLAFMSGRVMNTKVNGLMCILGKHKRHVITLVVKLPALLRCNLDCVRHAFGGLQALLQKREGFVYAMVCHAPSLLLLSPRGLHQRCSALRRCLDVSPEWCEQFSQLRPPGVAQLVLNRGGCLSTMMYLAQRRRAGAAPLEQLLATGPEGGPAALLGEAWPDFQAWMERRRQYLALRMRQQKAAERGAAVAGKAAAGVRRAARHGAAEQPLQQQQQHQNALSSAAAAVALGLSSAGTAAAAVGDGFVASSVSRHVQPDFADGAPRGHKVVGGLLASGDTCISSSNGAEGGSSRASSRSRDVECVSEGSGSAHQDPGVEAADRGQQQGSSTSGRLPSWLQLQAEYRRSLQSRARRKAASASQLLSRERRASAALDTTPPTKRARSRDKTGLTGQQGADTPGPPSTAAGSATAAAADAAATDLYVGSASSAAPGHTESEPSSLAAASPQLQSLASLEVAAAARTPELSWRHHRVSGVEHVAGGGRFPLSCTAGSNGSLASSGTLFNLHGPDPSNLQQQHHGLGVPLLSERARQGDSFASDNLSAQRGSSVVLGEEGLAAGGELVDGTGNVRSHSDGWHPTSGADHHAFDANAGGVPLWMHLDSGALRCGTGGPAHAVGGDEGYVAARASKGDGEERSSSRRTAALPSSDAPQHDARGEGVVVVSGDGSMHDIKDLGRDGHALGLRVQEPGAGLNIGQAQKLESALGATVPR